MTDNEILQLAAEVRPSRRQLEWYRNPFYAFVHFGVNTFTGCEWGDGTEDPAVFNPSSLDCDQWARAIKAAGMRGMVLTAKHHDGFCLWPSRYTEHSVKNSPFRGGRGDVVLEAAQACQRAGLEFGIYLSPWDRNSPLYGTDEYDAYYKNQLTELLTGYGKIFHIWFDGACGEGVNGRRQNYDFPGYVRLIRRYQPNATIFSDHGPDVRWIGNEAGVVRDAEWAVVPHELTWLAEEKVSLPQNPGLERIECPWASLGDSFIVRQARGLSFCPAEADMSIRKGWFYHEQEAPMPAERLFDTYLNTVGRNAGFHLNVPPGPDGLLDKRDVACLAQLGELIRTAFSHEITAEAVVTSEGPGLFRVALPGRCRVSCVELCEPIARGQRVESFMLTAADETYGWTQYLCQGTTIGARRLCWFSEPAELSEFFVRITASRMPVDKLSIRLFA